jgi:UDP-N-acetylmuramyl pentapeptide phosphotransferase/UDP-N-acetylglucosamine-1-phosphate transferase
VTLGEGLVAGAGSALALAAGLCALVAWAGPLDAPRARGLHTRPTVTSGGVAVIAAAAAGLLVFALAARPTPPSLGPVALALGLAGALGHLGALDDLIDMGAKAKLLAQVLLGLLFSVMVARIEALPLAPGLALSLGAVAGALGTTLWLVVAANAVNFTDGANGLASGAVAVALATLGAGCLIEGAPAPAAAAFAGAAALVGFLPWNLVSGRLFQGDAGALFSGFLAAALAVVAADRVPLYLAPFALTPLLTDVLLTLLVRARRGERLFEAHRDHLYQLWLRRTGRSHAALALRVWAITGIYGLAGLASLGAPAGIQPLLFALGVAVAASLWLAARRRLELRRSG